MLKVIENCKSLSVVGFMESYEIIRISQANIRILFLTKVLNRTLHLPPSLNSQENVSIAIMNSFLIRTEFFDAKLEGEGLFFSMDLFMAALLIHVSKLAYNFKILAHSCLKTCLRFVALADAFTKPCL